MSRFRRVNRWLMFARQWHLVDATGQDAYKLGERVATHLAGKHKPIYHPETDCGDHVVVINCKDVAMHGFAWKHTLYLFDKEYPKSKALIPAWQIHEYDPCRIVYLAVYKSLGSSVVRRTHIQRLHLLPNNGMPEFIRRNIGAQMEQVQSVPKRSDEYTEEERAAFPRLFKFSDSHVIDWEKPIDDPGRFAKENVKAKK